MTRRQLAEDEWSDGMGWDVVGFRTNMVSDVIGNHFWSWDETMEIYLG